MARPKKPAKKLTKQMKEAFEDALEPPASVQTVPVATVEVRLPIEQAQILAEEIGNHLADSFLDADNFNEFAPNMGLGEDPLNQETGEFHVPEEPTTDAEPVEPEETPALPSTEPVVTSQPVVRHIVPQHLPDRLEGPTDAQIVERLINAINYLYPIARLTKGLRGPQPEKVDKIIGNIKLARKLLERL